jgi:protoporphyrin/coproporphyrin ferrochelatase
MKKGILLINLGTPDACDVTSVSNYLHEFLNDPRVIDLSAIVRWILVNLIIIPFRVKKTTRAYQKIWLGAGSPLLVHSLTLKQALEEELGEAYHVELGMRYGNPSIQSALDKLKSCNHVTVLPLFPQYSSAASGSAMEDVINIMGKNWNIPSLVLKKDFYAEPDFIAAYADIIRRSLADKKIDRLIFSYHGLPERHIQKSECQASCEKPGACPEISDLNAYCYRAQCYATSRLLADALNLAPDEYCVAFQSRLGHTPWVKPYTDLVLPKLIQKGIKHIAVVCPSFVADCLETLEEVDIRMRAQWLKLGGEGFTCVPCLNASPRWVAGLKNMIEAE